MTARGQAGIFVGGHCTRHEQRIAELEKENDELRAANEVLRSVSGFFAGTGDSPGEENK